MIILASKSASRATMLTDAGVSFESRPTNIDERALEARMADAKPSEVATALAEAKALAVTGRDAFILGSDSLVVVHGRRFDKPANRSDAIDHLRFFSGRTMDLYAAAAIARDGKIVWAHVSVAKLHFRALSEEYIVSYLDAEWPEVGQCVGAFRIESLGVQLFERIEGDHFTILGMPLLPVLAALRDLGVMPS